MGYRRASSTILMVIVAIFLLALDRSSVAHARQVRSPSMSTAENPSTKEVMQATRKPGVEHSGKVSTETVHMKPGSTGEAGVVGRRVEQPSFVRGGNSSPASAEKLVVVARDGPRPHPKKHN